MHISSLFLSFPGEHADIFVRLYILARERRRKYPLLRSGGWLAIYASCFSSLRVQLVGQRADRLPRRENGDLLRLSTDESDGG